MSPPQHVAPTGSNAGRVRRKLAVAALSLLALWAAWHFWLDPGRAFATAKFNAEVWREKPTLPMRICHRGGMAVDIRDNLLDPKMTGPDVEALLGPPDHRIPQEYEYELGFCSGVRIDVDVLHVYFDESGKYRSAVIRQH